MWCDVICMRCGEDQHTPHLVPSRQDRWQTHINQRNEQVDGRNYNGCMVKRNYNGQTQHNLVSMPSSFEVRPLWHGWCFWTHTTQQTDTQNTIKPTHAHKLEKRNYNGWRGMTGLRLFLEESPDVLLCRQRYNIQKSSNRKVTQKNSCIINVSSFFTLGNRRWWYLVIWLSTNPNGGECKCVCQNSTFGARALPIRKRVSRLY